MCFLPMGLQISKDEHVYTSKSKQNYLLKGYLEPLCVLCACVFVIVQSFGVAGGSILV